MPEFVTLDPTAVATGRTAVDITPWLTPDGVDWGDAAIEQYMAKGHIGSDPVDYDIPNRQVSMPLRLMARGTVTFATIRRQLQAKTALMQDEGGWLSRVTTAGTFYADVVNATLRLGGDWMQASRDVDIDATLSLELKPDFYGSEITLDDKTETTLPVLTTVLKQSAADAVIAGDYPGRIRVVVDEDDADTQLGLLWGFRSRYYDSATTAALFYEAEALTRLDAATVGPHTGASGGTVVTHSSLGLTWVPVLSTTMITGTADLTHQGTYRVWARCKTLVDTQTPSVRLVWDVGDLVSPEENDPVTLPTSGSFYWLDLGEVRLDAPPVGTHRWRGVIQGNNGDHVLADVAVVYVDCIAFQPIDDGAGRCTASLNSEPGLVSYSARDEFNHTAGVLTGKVMSVGGTWAGAGDADDFNATGSSADAVTRSVADSVGAGHYGLAGTAVYATIGVQTDVGIPSNPASGVVSQAVFARYVDTNNWVRFRIIRMATFLTIEVNKKLAGSETTLRSLILSSAPAAGAGFATYTIRLVVLANGQWLAYYGAAGSGSPRLTLAGQDADFVTGAALDDGRIGMYDESVTSTLARSYDNFVAWVPVMDAVIYPSQSAQLTSDGMFREDITGTAYGPLSPTGGLPRVPASGLENRKVEFFLKVSRGEFDTVPDSGIDNVSEQMFYRPSWLTAPGS